MIKKRFISMLVLLMTAVTGAWATITVTWNNGDITGTGHGTSFAKDGVTITAGDIDFSGKNFMLGGTFTTTLGNFTKIEVTTGMWNASGTGWSGSTWTGNASSVSFSGDIVGMGMGNTKFVFTIEPPTVAVTGVTLAPTSATLTLGETETVTLIPTVLPGDATDKSVTWSSSNEAVATVTDGVVTAVAAGEATITVTTTDGAKTATCAVTVAAPAASTYTVTLKEGTDDADKWTITPAEATTTGVAAGTEVKASYGGVKKVKSVKAKKKAAAPAEETVTWDNTNVFVSGNSEVTADKDNPYTYGGVSISFSGNSWLQLYDSGQDVTKLIVRADAVCTFTAPSGKKFTRIEITDNFYATFTAYGDWAMDGEAKAIWSGTASNTVTLGSSENSFFTNLKSIVFTMEEAAAAPALNLTSPAVGQVIGDDGKNYDYASLPGGVTAVAKICYVSGSNGLALALADEGKMDWSTAQTVCAAHTAPFTGGTWKLATKDEWSNMISAAGSYSALHDGFSSVGGTNMQEDFYWSSTEYDSDFAWYYDGYNEEDWDNGDKVYDLYVRACLAF